ncbi:peptidoglycan recognition protein family protein [Streptomyces violaceusniger]|uniref:N-acetylmuramoyl-L-alanine amidase family 2 n=1 Tax=Streptomyces violaceusniger (strain Tu 4113) TaxID=653045 RepID=G2PAL6_STRV4|nr:peptidoglycan recognition protein [Streptomyces violaceusniger]AEM87742.1 N-acetylmuramoyl-L-alanine amidase family 2 [Streptomyces violaceusniger Tu 4113]
MRAYLASSIGVACTAALALPLAVYPGPAHARAERTAATSFGSGSTQSLPLLPLVADGLDRGLAASGGDAPAPAPADRGVAASRVRPFSLVGVVWDQPSADLRGRVQVRTRAVGGEWSPWRELLPYGDDGPDPDSPELRGVRAHGGTAPLWVGDSDGVQARVRPEEGVAVADGGAGAGVGAGAAARSAALPSGLRLELIDPGEAPAPPPPDRAVLRALPAHPVPTAGAAAKPGAVSAPGGAAPGTRPSAGSSGKPSWGHSGVSAQPPSRPSRWSARPSPRPSRPSVEPSLPSRWSAKPSPGPAGSSAKPLPYPSTHSTHSTPPTSPPSSITPPPNALAEEATKANAARYSAPRPSIVTRAGWGADEKIRETGHVYSKTVKVAFIHHTVTGNKYRCSQAPSVMRSIYRYHVKSLGWRDYGYNFTIDKCGKIYEGRSGGVTKAVRGAHTLGFNTNSMGVAVLGTFSAKKPPAKAVKAIAKLTAWKLGLFKRNPRGTTHLVSGGGNKYKKGASVKLHVIAGHRDGFATECPGKDLYKKLGSVRKTAARLQGR